MTSIFVGYKVVVFFFTSSVATDKAKGKASHDPCSRAVITMSKAI